MKKKKKEKKKKKKRKKKAKKNRKKVIKGLPNRRFIESAWMMTPACVR